MNNRLTRSDFIRFLGVSATTPGLASQFACRNIERRDELDTLLGTEARLLIKAEESFGNGLRFGHHNDYLAYLPISPSERYLWVNHESFTPAVFGHPKDGDEKTKSQVDIERSHVGGSLLRLKKDKAGWQIVKAHTDNRRYDATTKIEFAWEQEIAGSRYANGTLANCAGGVTPYGTFLSCEENTHKFYGGRDRPGEYYDSRYGWQRYYSNPPEHYGWVVEIDPRKKTAKKLVALGRFEHECATVHKLAEFGNRHVVYSGEDRLGGFLFRFISNKAGSLERGELQVADTENGRWLPLVYEQSDLLKSKFKSQTEVLTYTHYAAELVGATPQDRPEDIAVDPVSGDIFIALTKNKSDNHYGSIMKLTETSGGRFRSETFITGGEATGFACPDNIAFDGKGNLWFTTDVYGGYQGKGPYRNFIRNGLFIVPRSGKQAGNVIPVAWAPAAAEFTGPCFMDKDRLWVSVQHPGEDSKSPSDFTSRWPDGGRPLSAVVEIAIPDNFYPLLLT